VRRIDLSDAGFLLAEKRETPMHVGGVNLFTLPRGADEHEFLTDLAGVLRNASEFRKPFGEYMKLTPLGLFWEKDAKIDLDYHVRHSALPKPGRYRELFALVSRLHSALLDRNRPLWETHLIEGLQNRQFAMYTKVHHAAIDGVGAMQLAASGFSLEPSERVDFSPFSLAAFERLKTLQRAGRRDALRPEAGEIRNVLQVLREVFDSGVNLGTAMTRFSSAFIGRGGNLAVPWHNVPRTSINTRVTGARRFVAQSWDFQRVRAVCRALDGTLNDIVLAMCSGALRRYLLSRRELPAHSLKAMAPISTREEGDLESANAVAFITADLATNTADPQRRLRQIQASMHAGKSLFHDLSPRESALFTQLTQLPAILTSVLGLAARYPAFSTVISNVPGPRQPLYWNGARLDGMYPASIVFDGFAMNITLVSYHDSLDFGIIACRRSLPQIQRIIDHLEEALQELEVLGGLRTGGAARRARRPAATGRKAGTGQRSRRKAPDAGAATKAGPDSARAKRPAKGRPAKGRKSTATQMAGKKSPPKLKKNRAGVAPRTRSKQ